MVTVFLRGGLGNQMFQYALGLNLTKRNNANLAFDTVFLNDRFPRREFSYRKFDLDIFPIEARFTFLSKISQKFPVPGFWLAIDLLLMKLKEVSGIQKIVKEKEEFRFYPGALKEKENLILWGRWQNARYLSGIEDELRAAFHFRFPLFGEAKKLGEKIKSLNSVSIHVRRGDYVNFKNMKTIVGETNVAYYEAAIRYVAERVDRPHFFIFSDDLDWCRKNLKISFPHTFMTNETTGPKDSFHLELMSSCKHNIIANSTFSWWGAWLNQNPGKIIVAPKQWERNNDSKKTGVVPEEWAAI
jgi:hypothetical protein